MYDMFLNSRSCMAWSMNVPRTPLWYVRGTFSMGNFRARSTPPQHPKSSRKTTTNQREGANKNNTKREEGFLIKNACHVPYESGCVLHERYALKTAKKRGGAGRKTSYEESEFCPSFGRKSKSSYCVCFACFGVWLRSEPCI